jgi:acetaldehyde dehydrogenase (acetylating)
MDKDLSSIQEARDLAQKAHAAWKSWSHVTQAEVNRVCAAMAEAGSQASERVGRLAQEETGYGVVAHKKIKNDLAWFGVGEHPRFETVGVIRRPHAACRDCRPMGVVVALVPSTNPTHSLYKALIAGAQRDRIRSPPLSRALHL